MQQDLAGQDTIMDTTAAGCPRMSTLSRPEAAFVQNRIGSGTSSQPSKRGTHRSAQLAPASRSAATHFTN